MKQKMPSKKKYKKKTWKGSTLKVRVRRKNIEVIGRMGDVLKVPQKEFEKRLKGVL